MALSLYTVGKGRRGKRNNDGKPKKARSFSGFRLVGLIRIQMDLDELELPDFVELSIANKETLQKFDVIITPDTGYWKDVTYIFEVEIPNMYPYRAPEVKSKQYIFHPCVDKELISLDILNRFWRPTLTFQQVIFGLCWLLVYMWQPQNKSVLVSFGYVRNLGMNIPDGIVGIIVEYLNIDCDADGMAVYLNSYAAGMRQNGGHLFDQLIRKSLKGGIIDDVQYPKLI